MATLVVTRLLGGSIFVSLNFIPVYFVYLKAAWLFNHFEKVECVGVLILALAFYGYRF